MEGKERGVKDDLGVFDSVWVLVPLTEYGRSRFGGGGG